MRRGLYLVTPDWDDSERLMAATEAALRGGAVCVQYRHKTAPAALRDTQAAMLRTLTRQFGAALIVNDDIELARRCGADGLHLGRDDGELGAVRAAVGPDFVIGASCYDDFARAAAAAAAGASYVAFGAMYPSPTKPHAVAADKDLIVRARRELDLPVACIGGITADNAAPLVAAGADWLAVITDVYGAADPQQRAARFAALYA